MVGERDPIVQVGHGEVNFTFPLSNYGCLLPLLLDPTPGPYSWTLRTTALYSHHDTAKNAQRLCGGEGHHTYSFVRQPTDKNKLHRRLLCCIHDHLAFDDIAARPSCGSY